MISSGGGVSGQGGLENVLGGDRVDLPTRGVQDRPPFWRARRLSALLSYRRSAHERLEVTGPAARAGRPVEVDDHVSDLAAEPAGAAVRLAVDEHSAADSGAERDHQEVARALPDTETVLTERRKVPVVVERDLSLGARHHERTHVDAGQRQVGAELDRLAQEVDLRGQADADSRDLARMDARLHLPRQVDDRIDDRERPVLGVSLLASLTMRPLRSTMPAAMRVPPTSTPTA